MDGDYFFRKQAEAKHRSFLDRSAQYKRSAQRQRRRRAKWNSFKRFMGMA